MSKTPYTQPTWQGTAFNCPHCHAYANQRWSDTSIYFGSYKNLANGCAVAFCTHCNKYSLWHEYQMIYPEVAVEQASADLPTDVTRDYSEASSVLQKSPRSAAALLRLAVQKLCVSLGEKGHDLNTDIGNLVKKGLPIKVQQALDAVRVIGNNAVHPGQLDLKDDRETATSLFRLINLITEKMIAEPREIDAVYAKLPDESRKQIEKRDGKNQSA